MGRTQHTYRMRLRALSDHLMKVIGTRFRSEYQRLWSAAHNLSAPASTLPWLDTYAIATYCVILELMVKINELESKLKAKD